MIIKKLRLILCLDSCKDFIVQILKKLFIIMTKAEIIIEAAKSALGSPYVFGAWGQECTTATRRKYAGYNQDHRNAIYNACPQLTRKQSDCKGCKYWRYCEGGGMHLRDNDGKLLLCHMKRMGEASSPASL